jgi:hypothetical protein
MKEGGGEEEKEEEEEEEEEKNLSLMRLWKLTLKLFI